MEIPCIITPTTAAVTKVINTAKDGRPGCLSVVGTLGTGKEVVVQKPVVNDPDETNDAHWTALQLEGAPVVLRDGHDAEPIPVSLFVRISKPATDTDVGVAWS